MGSRLESVGNPGFNQEMPQGFLDNQLWEWQNPPTVLDLTIEGGAFMLLTCYGFVLPHTLFFGVGQPSSGGAVYNSVSWLLR